MKSLIKVFFYLHHFCIFPLHILIGFSCLFLQQIIGGSTSFFGTIRCHVISKFMYSHVFLFSKGIVLIVANGFEPLVAFLLVANKYNIREVLEPRVTLCAVPVLHLVGNVDNHARRESNDSSAPGRTGCRGWALAKMSPKRCDFR